MTPTTNTPATAPAVVPKPNGTVNPAAAATVKPPTAFEAFQAKMEANFQAKLEEALAAVVKTAAEKPPVAAAPPVKPVYVKPVAGKLTLEQQLANALAENEALKAAKTAGRTLGLKVGPSGGLSVYGLGRFPVTLFREQWKKLLAFRPEIEAFIIANDHLLKTKGE